MKNIQKYWLFVVIILSGLFPAPVLAQIPVNYNPDSLKNKDSELLSLQQLMEVKVTVASEKELTVRESPAVITLISADELKNSGARDLMDIIRLVPGFDFAQDVDNIIGLGVRGNWGHESKVLLTIDGQALQETSYGNLQFAQHYPIENIERIEIIRGPGSVVYGGSAALAVINIITKTGKELKGGSLHFNYGQLERHFGRINGTASFGQQFENGINLSASLSYNSGIMSDRLIPIDSVTNLDYADSSKIKNMYANVGLKYKGLDVRYIYDNYVVNVTERSLDFNFESHLVGLQYNIKVNDKFKIIPRFNFKAQKPWNSSNELVGDTTHYTNVFNTRYSGRLLLDYQPWKVFNLLAGAEFFQDNSRFLTKDPYMVFTNGQSSVHYINLAGYLQGSVKTKHISGVLGLRYNWHNLFEPVLVPRAALTGIFGVFHTKLLYSMAFKAPTIYNLQVNPAIKPELVQVGEVEVGLTIAKKLQWNANLYYMKVKNSIAYFQNGVTENFYNFSKSGTYGVETELKYKDNFGFLALSYSYYNILKSTVPIFQFADSTISAYPAFANHTVKLNGSIKIIPNFYFNPSGIFYSRRYYYNQDGSDASFSPCVLLNAYLNYNNAFTKGLTIGVGVYDLLGVNFKFPQAYNSGYSPLPGPGREIIIKLSYQFNWK